MHAVGTEKSWLKRAFWPVDGQTDWPINQSIACRRLKQNGESVSLLDVDWLILPDFCIISVDIEDFLLKLTFSAILKKHYHNHKYSRCVLAFSALTKEKRKKNPGRLVLSEMWKEDNNSVSSDVKYHSKCPRNWV